jgi:hypothetical protein
MHNYKADSLDCQSGTIPLKYMVWESTGWTGGIAGLNCLYLFIALPSSPYLLRESPLLYPKLSFRYLHLQNCLNPLNWVFEDKELISIKAVNLILLP